MPEAKTARKRRSPSASPSSAGRGRKKQALSPSIVDDEFTPPIDASTHEDLDGGEPYNLTFTEIETTSSTRNPRKSGLPTSTILKTSVKKTIVSRHSSLRYKDEPEMKEIGSYIDTPETSSAIATAHHHHYTEYLFVLGVSAILAHLVTDTIASAPCFDGPCWLGLSLAQLMLLTMLLVAGGVRILQLSRALLRKFVLTAEHTSSEATIQSEVSRLAHPKTEWTQTLDIICRLGGILLIFYICDRTTLIKHVDKHYDRTHFILLSVLFLLLGLITTTKNEGKDSSDILNRDQTEEWKGWMQIIFLLFHYYNAQEIYAPIRVFVSSYVFLTGFGNFCSFLKSGDFGWYRAAVVLWRLNCLTILLVLAMDTWYQLYYVVPISTFYFALVYLSMSLGGGAAANRRPWALETKLAFLFLAIYYLWDMSPSTLRAAFSPAVGHDPARLHEWHFRTYLDHYSAPLGMLFAMCLPAAARGLAAAERLPAAPRWAVKGAVGAALAAAAGWAMFWAGGMSKEEYNARHPYIVGLVILAYIYWRNFTPELRSHSSWLFRAVGRLTLEAYLAQFHLLLAHTGAAGGRAPAGYCKQILEFLPARPGVNAVLAGGALLWVSWHLMHDTGRLREMLLPSDPAARRTGRMGRNCFAAAVAAAAAIAYAVVARRLGFGPAQYVAGLALPTAIVYSLAEPADGRAPGQALPFARGGRHPWWPAAAVVLAAAAAAAAALYTTVPPGLTKAWPHSAAAAAAAAAGDAGGPRGFVGSDWKLGLAVVGPVFLILALHGLYAPPAGAAAAGGVGGPGSVGTAGGGRYGRQPGQQSRLGRG